MSNLIPIAELTPDVVKKWPLDMYTAYLSKQPNNEWLKKHPLNGSWYLPIDKVEYLLRKIFKEFRIEVLRESTMFNSVYVSVRVHYFHPITESWEYHDGVGAWDVQTKKGESVADLSQINHMAVAKALPAAKSAAIKDACHHFGDLFGANLNREETLQYKENEQLKDKAEGRVQAMVDECETVDDLLALIKQVPDQYSHIVEKRIEEINAED